MAKTKKPATAVQADATPDTGISADAPPPPDAARVADAVIQDAPEPPTPELSYRVLSPLRHDGRHFRPGDRVALSASQSKRLIAQGVVEG